MKIRSSALGFTLMELILVIVLLSILSLLQPAVLWVKVVCLHLHFKNKLFQ